MEVRGQPRHQSSKPGPGRSGGFPEKSSGKQMWAAAFSSEVGKLSRRTFAVPSLCFCKTEKYCLQTPPVKHKSDLCVAVQLSFLARRLLLCLIKVSQVIILPSEARWWKTPAALLDSRWYQPLDSLIRGRSILSKVQQGATPLVSKLTALWEVMRKWHQLTVC